MGGYRLLVNEFWFLPSLFMNCVIIIIVTYFCKGKTILLLSSLIINIALHFVSKYLPATYVFMFSCFLTGFFYNMYIGKSLTINKPNFLILFCCTLILFVCYYNFHHDIYVYTLMKLKKLKVLEEKSFVKNIFLFFGILFYIN